MINAVTCTFIVSYISSTLGATFEIVKDHPGEDLRCNYTATVICNFAVNKSSINWKIAKDVDSTSTVAAQCFSSSCSVNPDYAANYSFTFNKLIGMSNVTIKKVTVEQDNLEFKCDDGTPPNKVKLYVRDPPDEKTTVKRNVTVGNDTLLSIETPCVYPVQDIVIEWYSVGEDRILHTEEDTTNITCNNGSDCILANKSAQFTSVLNISKITLSNGKNNIQMSRSSSTTRSFEVVIKYGSTNTTDITIKIGNFSVQGSYNASAPSTNTTGTEGKSQNYTYVVIGAVSGFGAFLIIVFVIVFCCIYWRKQRKRKPTKHLPYQMKERNG